MYFFTNRFFRPFLNTSTIVAAAIFIALDVIFTHVFAIQTPFIRISFGFLPIAIFAARYGAIKGAVVSALADILGCLIFSPGLFFPGFTLSAFIAGLIYGFSFHNKKVTIQRTAMASIMIFLFVDLFLNTLWLSILYHKAAQLFFISRLIKCSILLPVQIILIYAVCKSLHRQIAETT